MIEILSIILQDGSDAEASIILKEGLYEPDIVPIRRLVAEVLAELERLNCA